MDIICIAKILWSCFCDWKEIVDSSGNKTAIFLTVIVLIHLGVL